MTVISPWPTMPGTNARKTMRGALAAKSYLKFFQQDFWRTDFRKQGHEALKLTTEAVPSLFEWDTTSWDDTRNRYGEPASKWMFYAWTRLSDDSENQLLWRWLFYRTQIACQPQRVAARWFVLRQRWWCADFSAWNVQSDVRDAFAMMDEAFQRSLPPREHDPRTTPNVPPVDVIRKFFAVFGDAVRYFNVEAAFNQNFAAGFIRLAEGPEKQSIFDRYAEKMRTRIDSVYMAAIDRVTDVVTYYINALFSDTRILQWLSRYESVMYLLNTVKFDLHTRLGVARGFFQVVRNLFSDVASERRVGVQQMDTLPSGATRTLAQRIENMALFQYSTLAADDPQKQVADEWMQILQNGDILRNPPAGSEAENINAVLEQRTGAVDQRILSVEEQLERQIPDPQGGKAVAESGLQAGQPPSQGE